MSLLSVSQLPPTLRLLTHALYSPLSSSLPLCLFSPLVRSRFFFSLFSLGSLFHTEAFLGILNNAAAIPHLVICVFMRERACVTVCNHILAVFLCVCVCVRPRLVLMCATNRRLARAVNLEEQRNSLMLAWSQVKIMTAAAKPETRDPVGRVGATLRFTVTEKCLSCLE